MSSDKIRVGIVGCGNIITAHLDGLRILAENGMDSFRVVALCDNRVDMAARFRKRGEGPEQVIPKWIPWRTEPIYLSDIHPDTIPDAYSDWREMLASARLDAVLITAPIFLHHEIALECAAAGVHVLTEKPFAITMRAGHKMIEAAEKNHVQMGVGECVRYTQPFRTAQHVTSTGMLGRTQMYHSCALGVSLMLGLRPDDVLDGTPWRHSKMKGAGGVALDSAVHMFHKIRGLCGGIREIGATAPAIESERVLRDGDGRTIETVTCEIDDTFFTWFQFENGGWGNIAHSRAGHGEPTRSPEVIYGDKGCLKGGELILDDGKTSLNEIFEKSVPEEQKQQWFPKGIKDPFALEDLDFFRAIETGKPMETNAHEGLRDLACCFAVLESAAVGQTVRVQDVYDGKVETYQKPINAHYGL